MSFNKKPVEVKNVRDTPFWNPVQNLPVGMTECENYGINGDCGEVCPVFQRGECEALSCHRHHQSHRHLLDGDVSFYDLYYAAR